MIDAYLDKLADVQTNVAARTAAGGIGTNWTNRLSAIPCAVYPATGELVAQFGHLSSVVSEVVITAADIAAKAGERLIVDSRTHAVVAYRRFEFAPIGNLYLTATSTKDQ